MFTPAAPPAEPSFPANGSFNGTSSSSSSSSICLASSLNATSLAALWLSLNEAVEKSKKISVNKILKKFIW